jgi:N-methylhydantoinase A
MYRIGVDVGGTFTDFTILDDARAAVTYFKLPSTPADPSEAIEAGLAQILAQGRIDPARDRPPTASEPL